jgi:6-pyruvoyltetrahydropterin/6-carboxytetrahydropterin synthase
MRSFRVSVTKDYLVFASAHFITFAGLRCEPLHGHNYRVGVTLEGDLDEQSWYVVDFSELKRVMRALCDEIDHKVLLPLHNPKLDVAERNGSVTVAYEGKPKYVFPTEDCALLDIPNTTVEMLAQHLAARVRDAMHQLGVRTLSAIELEVEENFGQSATYRESLAAGAVDASSVAPRSRRT